MAKISHMTGSNNYFEDFEVGQVIRHARGKTITALENVNITNMVMNTASGHFDEHIAQKMGGFKASDVGVERSSYVISYGGVNFSVVLGLASQDTIENALAELGLDNIKLKGAVRHGDTLYAYSQVLEKKESDREDAGIVVFQHWGVNQDKKLIAEVQRTALIKKKSHWGDK